MIESYYQDANGYWPFLIRNGWQVAQLNYVTEHGLNDIVDVERHADTDEVFILVKGIGVLISVEFIDGKPVTKLIKMKVGVVYNVPAGEWHNIAMSRDCEIIIVEKDNTHLNDVDHRMLSKKDLDIIYKEIAELIDCKL